MRFAALNIAIIFLLQGCMMSIKTTERPLVDANCLAVIDERSDPNYLYLPGGPMIHPIKKAIEPPIASVIRSDICRMLTETPTPDPTRTFTLKIMDIRNDMVAGLITKDFKITIIAILTAFAPQKSPIERTIIKSVHSEVSSLYDVERMLQQLIQTFEAEIVTIMTTWVEYQD